MTILTQKQAVELLARVNTISNQEIELILNEHINEAILKRSHLVRIDVDRFLGRVDAAIRMVNEAGYSSVHLLNPSPMDPTQTSTLNFLI